MRANLRRILSNLDSAESVFFLRELEQVKRTTYDVIYPQLKARQFIPASSEPAGPGVETITFSQFDRVGAAKMIASYADDLPRVDVYGKQFSQNVKAIAVAYGYSLQEVRAAAMAGRPLPAMRAQAAREVAEEQIDALLSLGDTDTGLVGFLNLASATTATVATVNGATTWAQKAASDPDLISDDITSAIQTMLSTTNGREYPNSVLMPEAQMALLMSTRLVDQNISILAWLKASFPRITTWEPWYRLKLAGNSGSSDRAVVYNKDPGKVFYEVPQEFEALDVQPRNLEFVVPCHARVGGVISPYPVSITYLDGI